MPWQVAVVTQLLAGNSIINPNGIFVYNGTPANGNLMFALAPAAGTDSFGNAFIQGVQVGVASANALVELIPGLSSSGVSSVTFPIPPLSLSNTPNMSAAPLGGGTFADLVISGAALSAGGVNDWVQIVMYSNDTVGTFARGELRYIDTSGVAHVLLDWGKSDQAVHIPAGGGPFISGETFHDVSLAAGLSGRCRVKKLPWNAVFIDMQVAVSNANTSFTLGSLPDATYYPTVSTRLPAGFSGNSAALSIPTSGAISLLLGGSASGFNVGLDTMYPTN